MIVDGSDNQKADIHGSVTNGSEQIDVGGVEAKSSLEIGAKGCKGEEGARQDHHDDADREGDILECLFGENRAHFGTLETTVCHSRVT